MWSFAPLALAAFWLAERAIAGILAKVGHPGATLDDAYIHFQYARALAEGHPFCFQRGAPPTSGSTSLLWPALLAPFWAMGAKDEMILWPAWGLSFLALGGLALEAAKLTERLAGKTAAVGAAAMTLAFGGFLWCAASGMEVVPFAWVIARASRRSSEWVECAPAGRTPGRAAELVGLAWAAACFRPEGAVTALLVGGALASFTQTHRWRERARALLAGGAAGAPPLLIWMLTGSAKSSTAIVKLLPGNPYYPGGAVIAPILANVRTLVDTLLNGEAWSAEFLPPHGSPVALAGLGAVAILGVRKRLYCRSGAVLLLALTMFAPCFYGTFLWNRLRYLWPFATGFIVGLACLSRVVFDLAAAASPRWRAGTGLLCGAFVGLLASKDDGVLDDIANSASGIDRQQVRLGRWAKENLAPAARIGLNDTGAIAYFGDHRTFDVVGLTTREEGRYWVAGAASRFEHYERVAALAPTELPTHFIVYPEWMAMPQVLGKLLHEATVNDASILGGRTMGVYVADWSSLGTGEAPWTRTGPVVDELDVADLESESAHAYELLGARDGEETVHEGTSPAGTAVVDGGRTGRRFERFDAALPPGAPVRGVVRLEGPSGTSVRVLANGTEVAIFDLDEDDWVERTFDVPAGVVRPRTRIELVVGSGSLTTYHYWFVTPG